MSTTAGSDVDRRRGRAAGVLSAVLGVVGLAALGWLVLVSATPIDPPDWLRIAGIWLLPVGVIGALAAGIPALRRPPRAYAIIGVVAAALTAAGFILVILLWPA